MTPDTPTERTRFSDRELVLGAAVVMVSAQVALRVWMLWPSWFYGDDYALLGQAGASGDSLVEPYAGQFMPLGRLLARLVADAGPLDWHAAALSVVAMVVLADLACVWMLLELFGRRWGVLLPLAAYLTSAVVLPATMWWAAALNQLPLQVVLLAAVATWVRHLRTGRTRWWVVTGLILAVGLLAYVKVLLVLPVLAWLTLAHFATGGPWARVRDTVRSHVRALVVVGGAALAFLVWYVATVPSIVAADDRGAGAATTLDLAGTMLGRAVPVGLVGGPWRWGATNAPVVPADPPTWSVVAAWVVLIALAGLLAARRRRTGRVWGLLAAYGVGVFVLVAVTRLMLVGGVIGLEYRYLTDVVPVAVLCLALATMPVRDAVEPTEPRADRAPLPRLALGVGVVLAVSGLVSSVAYAQVWHTDHPAHTWFDRVGADLGNQGAVDVADAAVPESVVSGLVSPWNTLSRLLPEAGLDVSFPTVSTRIAHVDATGHVTQGFVEPIVAGVATADDGCGYRLGTGSDAARSVTVALEKPVGPGLAWLRVAYLASAADTVTVTAGAATGDVQISKGLGSIFVDLAAGADDVTVTVAGDATVCLGEIVAGPLLEGPPW